MRCKICQISHKNTKRNQLWIEQQICRVCGSICDYFSLNENHLHEYWN